MGGAVPQRSHSFTPGNATLGIPLLNVQAASGVVATSLNGHETAHERGARPEPERSIELGRTSKSRAPQPGHALLMAQKWTRGWYTPFPGCIGYGDQSTHAATPSEVTCAACTRTHRPLHPAKAGWLTPPGAATSRRDGPKALLRRQNVGWGSYMSRMDMWATGVREGNDLRRACHRNKSSAPAGWLPASSSTTAAPSVWRQRAARLSRPARTWPRLGLGHYLSTWAATPSVLPKQASCTGSWPAPPS